MSRCCRRRCSTATCGPRPRSPSSRSATRTLLRSRRPTRSRGPTRSGIGWKARRTAAAADSRCCTTSPPTATTSSRWRSSTQPPAVCRDRPSATSRSRFSIDGEPVALLAMDQWLRTSDPNGVYLEVEEPIFVRAGPRRVSAVFVRQFEGPVEDVLAPHEWSIVDTEIGDLGYGVTALPHMRDFIIDGPHDVTGVSETPSRQRVFTCRPTSPRDRASLRGGDRHPHRHAGLPPAADRDGHRRPDGVLRGGPPRRRLGDRDPDGAAGDTGQPGLPVPPGAAGGNGRAGQELPDLGRGPRVAPRVLPLGRTARRGAHRFGGRRQAVGPGRARRAGAQNAGRPAVGIAGRPVRRPVAAPPGHGPGPAGRVLVPELRPAARRRHAPRDGAAVRQPGARGPQLLRPVHGRLHVRERAAGPALRPAERRGTAVPARGPHRRPAAGPVRSRLRPHAHVDGQPHVAGTAGQVGDGSGPRRAAAAAAGRPCPTSTRRPRSSTADR